MRDKEKEPCKCKALMMWLWNLVNESPEGYEASTKIQQDITKVLIVLTFINLFILIGNVVIKVFLK